MLSIRLYLLGAVVLFVMGFFALLVSGHLLRRILALQIMGAGVFMTFIALAHPARGAVERSSVDPVPHALVLTGIVVAVSATALALSVACRYHAATGRSVLPEDDTDR
jgi:multicomponent Na+:H+ antiporter subunit C